MLELNKIYCGDCLEIMKEIDNESINSVITSPPYWALRDYGVEGQLGLEPTFEEYINKLCNIFDEVKRVLRKDGTCWVVMGDSYYGGGKGETEGINKAGGIEKIWRRPSREEYLKTGINKQCLYCGKKIKVKPNSQFCSRNCLNKMGNKFRSQNRLLPNKTLVMIPFRFAIEMVNRGWILRNTIIWYKPNCMPASVKDRFTVDFEYVFFFVKNKKYWFEQQLEKTLTKDNSSRNRDITKLNNTPGRSRMSGLKVNNYDFKNKRSVWQVTTKPFKEAHFAVYPEELIKPMIKAGCPDDGIILDPFIGSGTTGVMAKKLGRNFIGIEISEDYCKIANKRLANTYRQLELIK